MAGRPKNLGGGNENLYLLGTLKLRLSDQSLRPIVAQSEKHQNVQQVGAGVAEASPDSFRKRGVLSFEF